MLSVLNSIELYKKTFMKKRFDDFWFVFAPCWISFVWFLKTHKGHFQVFAVATLYIPILSSATSVVVLVGPGVQTETQWSCILEIGNIHWVV